MDLTKRLEKINAKSISNCNKLAETVDWSMTVNHGKLWFPETLTHLYHCAVYKTMNPNDRILYNQSFAQLTIEQTLFLESQFLSKIFNRIKNIHKGNTLLVQALSDFVEQEKEHTEVFKKLLKKSDPIYNKNYLHYFKNTLKNTFFTELACTMPKTFFVWAWLALYAEEKFVLIYRESNKQKDMLDCLHYDVHKYHMFDELNHTQVDDIVIDRLWDDASSLVKKVNAKLLSNFLQKTVLNSCHSQFAWNKLVERHPHLKIYTEQVIKELKVLHLNESYKKAILGKKNFPIFSRKLQSKPEFKFIASQ